MSELKYLIQRPLYPEWFAGWNIYGLATWVSVKTNAFYVASDDLHETLKKLQDHKPITILATNPKGGDAPCCPSPDTAISTGAAQSDPEAAPRLLEKRTDAKRDKDGHCTVCGCSMDDFDETEEDHVCPAGFRIAPKSAPGREDNRDRLNSEIRTQRGRIVE